MYLGEKMFGLGLFKYYNFNNNKMLKLGMIMELEFTILKVEN